MLSRVSFLLTYNLYVVGLHSSYFISGFAVGNRILDPYVHIFLILF